MMPLLTLTGTVASSSEKELELARMLIEMQTLQADTMARAKASGAALTVCQDALAVAVRPSPDTGGVDLSTAVLVTVAGVLVGIVAGGTFVLLNN
jgi:hypothetical protein